MCIEAYDLDKLEFGEVHELLRQIHHKMASLPAPAQRANQRGLRLSRKFNKLAEAAPGFRINDSKYDDLDKADFSAYEYKHLGALAYRGNAAVL